MLTFRTVGKLAFPLATCAAISLLLFSASLAQSPSFHNAPASAKAMKNPYAGRVVDAARTNYHAVCAKCHGDDGNGTGNIPSLVSGAARTASDGDLFWYITKGDIDNGMPSWKSLPAKERWQIVSFLRVLGTPNAGYAAAHVSPAEAAAGMDAPPPKAPFTDFRFEKPGLFRKITLNDLPAPFATSSAGNGPEVVPRPENAWPQVPPGFKVGLYVGGLNNPRLIRTAPNGDFFVAESEPGDIRVYRGITADGKPVQGEVFATGLHEPFGINFYPPGPNPQWVYVGDTDAVLRFPYQNGDLKARGPSEHIADLPHGRGHWTRDIQFTADGKTMYVSVGSASNVDDPDTHSTEKNRADVLGFNPDGSGMQVYAYGIRNCVGMAINSETGELWCSVNERDALGDNLVPDYITHVQAGGFYGWPWWYMGSHQDPRHEGKHPELKDKVITPDVILNPHNASLEMTFYEGKQFPAEYRGDIFASEHGSWNRSERVGYEVIRVPLHQSGHASGEYEDFMTGFVVDNGHVWGRPVGVTVAPDGSLLVTDDGSMSIWRISCDVQRIAVQAGSGSTLNVSVADLAGMPHQKASVEVHGKSVDYEGVPLRLVLEKADVAFGESMMHSKKLASYLLVEAADGYRAVFALPELDPGFTDRVILLADRVDGHPLDNKEGPFRIVVPGEKRMARWVRQVTALKVVQVE